MRGDGPIWALVSGLPLERARKRRLAMFQAFVDGSGTGAKDIFVLAGYVAPVEAWGAQPTNGSSI
jgi:hypothetical protein